MSVTLETVLAAAALILMAVRLGRLEAQVKDLDSYTTDLDNNLDYHMDQTSRGFLQVNDFVDTVNDEFAKISDAFRQLGDKNDSDDFS